MLVITSTDDEEKRGRTGRKGFYVGAAKRLVGG